MALCSLTAEPRFITLNSGIYMPKYRRVSLKHVSVSLLQLKILLECAGDTNVSSSVKPIGDTSA